MRKVFLTAAAVAALAAFGCGGPKSESVDVTAEMQAQEKRANEEVHAAESARQKLPPEAGKPTAEDEEAARSRRGR